jgi:hypothetical protein
MDKVDSHVAFDPAMEVDIFQPAGALSCTAETTQQQEHQRMAAASGSLNEDRLGSCIPASAAGRARYSLVGVVEHVGSLRSGHYVTYVLRGSSPVIRQDPASNTNLHVDSGAGGGGGHGEGETSSEGIADEPFASKGTRSHHSSGDGGWYKISDASVKAVGWSEVSAAQAYMLLYLKL